MKESVRLFSLAYLTIPDLCPVGVVRAASEAGFDMVGLRMLPATSEEGPFPLFTDDRVLRETAAALADTGISVGDIELIRLKPETDVAGFLSLFEKARYLGAHHIIVVSDDPDEARLTDRFARLCELAAPYELTMNLEPITWTALRDLEVAHAVAEAAGQANAGVLIDALHFHCRRTPLLAIKHIPPERLRIFQICDAPALFDPAHETLRHMARTARLLPGEGELDLAGLVRCMPASTIVSVEVPNARMIRDIPPMERARIAMRATRAFYASLAG